MQDLSNAVIIISRTDSIGDVMHTLPTCAWLKETYPSCTIIFLGRTYTKAIIDCYSVIDQFIDYTELETLREDDQVRVLKATNASHFLHIFPNKKIAKLAKKAKIKTRIGTSHRVFHWLTCNVRPSFTRKGSKLHEAQLNFELLKPLGLKSIPSLENINEFTSYFSPYETKIKDSELNSLLHKSFYILHPKSQGSAVEWPIDNYINLANSLLQNRKIVVFTGTEKEGDLFRNLLPKHDLLIDATGKCTLAELILLISKCQVLVACSTGPLHLAGFQNRKAIGLFSPRIPIHPERWAALGNKSIMLVFDENCIICKAKNKCECVKKIQPETVLNLV
jgi:heptosyltransferase III